MTKKRMVIFASGRGSNAVALHDAVEAGAINAEVKALVCDIPGAPVMDRAREWGVPVILADRKQFGSKAEFEQFILDQIAPYQATSSAWLVYAASQRRFHFPLQT